MKLGFDSLNIEATKEVRRHTRRIWTCDWIMLESLSNVSPIYDANMWRIYASEYNKNIDFLTEVEMQELCSINKEVITVFIVQNITKRLMNIINRWKTFAHVADDTFMGMNIPATAVVAFKSFLSFHKNNDIKDDEVSRYHAFSQLRAELLVNKMYMDDAGSRHPLSIEEFREFITAIAYEFQNLEARSNVINSSASDYKSRLQKAIEFTKAVLLICMGEQLERDSSYNLFEELIMWSDGAGRTAQIIRKTSALGNLDMAHAVCIYPDSKVEILSERRPATKVTETYRFLTVMMLQSDYLDAANKGIRGGNNEYSLQSLST